MDKEAVGTQCMKQCKVPEDWQTGLIVPIRKRDAQDPGTYRGITLLNHNYIMTLLDMLLDKRLRGRAGHELGEE